ncbi:hypothetical protein MRX96_026270 [Rhipicephalus microplus]
MGGERRWWEDGGEKGVRNLNGFQPIETNGAGWIPPRLLRRASPTVNVLTICRAQKTRATLQCVGGRTRFRGMAAPRGFRRERMIEFEPNDGPPGYGSLMEKKRAGGGTGAVPR